MPSYLIELLNGENPIVIAAVEAADQSAAEKIIEEKYPGSLILRMEEMDEKNPTRWTL